MALLETRARIISGDKGNLANIGKFTEIPTEFIRFFLRGRRSERNRHVNLPADRFDDRAGNNPPDQKEINGKKRKRDHDDRCERHPPIAKKIRKADPLVVIPAFTGLGAPYWRADVRGAIFGITRGTTREMLVKATLDSIAFQVAQVFELMKKESGITIRSLKVDGGASRNGYLMQRQADVLGVPILQTDISESTAWGAAKLAGHASGFWPDLKAVDQRVHYKQFQSNMDPKTRRVLLNRWKEAVHRLIA